MQSQSLTASNFPSLIPISAFLNVLRLIRAFQTFLSVTLCPFRVMHLCYWDFFPFAPLTIAQNLLYVFHRQ